ncbi:hypothetical protein IscW_ISCW021208 [Ixodes scapularis]|uniref:Uncharacterized protein n=1 Tax=Ixodes scapularis TaxID=6945 RepID=B7Q939_IXOSC|nr:hypothetical protein IscW_ISCW021208 [Ixodes scapularis]|eukprot:XP_002405584.1 hypothetical protein IscW_ISCW021208 [Ixodes scapularis]
MKGLIEPLRRLRVIKSPPQARIASQESETKRSPTTKRWLRQPDGDKRTYLEGRLPEEEHLIPHGYTRWEKVRLRRLRTNTTMIPAKFEPFKDGKNWKDLGGLDPRCKNSDTDTTMTTRHMLWDREGLADIRHSTLGTLPSVTRQERLENWIRPKESIQH